MAVDTKNGYVYLGGGGKICKTSFSDSNVVEIMYSNTINPGIIH